MTLVAVALRRVRAADADLTSLDPRERALLGPAATPKRRAEFAAGRAAAHEALLRLLGDRARRSSVLRAAAEATGRPVAVDADGAPLGARISITHTAGLAAAAAAAPPIGIDVVSLERVDDSFREEAFRPDELAIWEAWLAPDVDPSRAACIAFAAKEAALKWLGTGLALPLHAVRVVPRGDAREERLGGRIRASSFPMRIEAPAVDVEVEGWLAASPRRVLVAACGAGS